MKPRQFPILFMHIPKSAGTSVISIISKPFRDDEICQQPPHGTWLWRGDEVRGYKLYRGHFSADFIRELNTGGTKLIMLRHPLHRVVSLYDFWRSYRWKYIRSSLPPVNGPAVAKSGDLSAFINTTSHFALRRIYNPAARQLLGSRYDELLPDEDAVIHEAIAALRDFAWVGITERFAPSIALLGSVLDMQVPERLPKDLSTYEISPDDPTYERVEKSAPTDEQRGRILEGNRIDMSVYEEGTRILEERSRR